MTSHIKPGQVYKACHPLDDILIRIESYTPGHARAHVVDARTGKRQRQMLVTALHQSATTATGQPRRTGYALVDDDR